MAQATVYIDTNGGQKQVMRDVARMEIEVEGVLLIDLFGERTFVQARIKSIDFIDKHAVVLEEDMQDDDC